MEAKDSMDSLPGMGKDEVEVEMSMTARTGRERQRYGADGSRLVAGCIPVKPSHSEEGTQGWEVLLVSRRRGPGWSIPKGGWEDNETAEEAAARESWEEAGVRGPVHHLGQFDFASKNTGDPPCIASVYVMHVSEVAEDWPERRERDRRWHSLPAAIEACKHSWMQDALCLARDCILSRQS